MSYDNELYQQVILDHNRNPRNFHEIKDASHSCHGVNPLCGDDITVFMNVDEEEGLIKEVSFLGSGCAISKASTSLMTTFLKGKNIEICFKSEICEKSGARNIEKVSRFLMFGLRLPPQPPPQGRRGSS